MNEPAALFLPETDSTNSHCKRNISGMQHLQAVYSTSQTQGRGRLGRSWQNSPGQALYYSIVFKDPLADPASLPLAASLAVANALQQVHGTAAQIKWPNDLLLGGKKLVGILCEGFMNDPAQPAKGMAVVCGIGINLCQTNAQLQSQGLTHATSIEEFTQSPVPCGFAHELAAALSAQFQSNAQLQAFYARGFCAIRESYCGKCVNLGKKVWFTGGSGIARTVDETGRLVVETPGGETAVFTGEVSVKGIYGRV